jgi:hypothetical protein
VQAPSCASLNGMNATRALLRATTVAKTETVIGPSARLDRLVIPFTPLTDAPAG